MFRIYLICFFLFIHCIAFKCAKHTLRLSYKFIHNIKHIFNYVSTSQINIWSCKVQRLCNPICHRFKLKQIVYHVLHVDTFIHLHSFWCSIWIGCICYPFFIIIILGGWTFPNPEFKVSAKLDQVISYFFNQPKSWSSLAHVAKTFSYLDTKLIGLRQLSFS